MSAILPRVRAFFSSGSPINVSTFFGEAVTGSVLIKTPIRNTKFSKIVFEPRSICLLRPSRFDFQSMRGELALSPDYPICNFMIIEVKIYSLIRKCEKGNIVRPKRWISVDQCNATLRILCLPQTILLERTKEIRIFDFQDIISHFFSSEEMHCHPYILQVNLS